MMNALVILLFNILNLVSPHDSSEIRTGDQIVAYQRVTGGWPKNVDMSKSLSSEELNKVLAEKSKTDDSTIDNGATVKQMRFLATIYRKTNEAKYKDSFRKGVQYLLSAQYDNGGWPQFWPNPKGYKVNITYNDDAMVNVLDLLGDIYRGEGDFSGDIVSGAMRKKCEEAFSKGIDCILNTQIIVDGCPTVWCQQHDPNTLVPAKARAYELPSYCSAESAWIVRLLMSLPCPDKRVRNSVVGAMKWFQTHSIDGKGKEWARFYDLEECLPFFCDRDGIARRNIEEISDERRYGYSWYSGRPATLLPAYREWKEKNLYSVRMVNSEMRRTPKSNLLDFASKPKWSYSVGIELESMLDTYIAYGDEALFDYLQDYPMTMIDSLGNTKGYKYEDFNLDNVRTAKFIFKIHSLAPLAGEDMAMKQYFSQLEYQPRTGEGPFWHKKIYHDQVWLDGIFMGLPFYTIAASSLSSSPKSVYNDVVNQIVQTDKLTYDSRSGLWKHAYDEKHQMFWADTTTGQSRHTWARALGWYSMAIMEVLETLPRDYERRDVLVELFNRVMKAVVGCRDKKSGVWFDVLDVKDKRNYIESTASCMFAYCLLKGCRLGYLDRHYGEVGKDAYESILRNFIKENADGTISLTRCCSVSGLGPESNPRRDGSFDYYMSEPVRDNDSKGVAPFIWASLEMERL